jgi:hypothetical protein
MAAIETHETYDKAHGREEYRKGYLLKMNVEALDSK